MSAMLSRSARATFVVMSIPDSVISREMRRASTPDVSSAVRTARVRSAAPICLVETLMNMRPVNSGWRARNPQASWSTNEPRGTTRFASSEISMNSAGIRSPLVGCSQRTSAS